MSSEVSIANIYASIHANIHRKASPYLLHLHKNKYQSSFELDKLIEMNSSKKVQSFLYNLIETDSVLSKGT